MQIEKCSQYAHGHGKMQKWAREKAFSFAHFCILLNVLHPMSGNNVALPAEKNNNSSGLSGHLPLHKGGDYRSGRAACVENANQKAFPLREVFRRSVC